MQNQIHRPVLLAEILDNLPFKKQVGDPKIIDATLGAGGYTKAFVKKGYKVLSLETDPIMLSIAQKNLSTLDNNSYTLVNSNFRNIKKIAEDQSFIPVDAVVFDLGISSFHLDSDDRGFSFRNPQSPLDMRLDPNSQNLKASDLLNVLREDQLKDLFSQILNYQETKNIITNIQKFRKENKFENVGDFIKTFMNPNNDLLAKAFMALRIAVNDEYATLAQSLEDAYEILAPEGKLLVVTFHSGEDRIVKKFMSQLVSQRQISPSDEEVNTNSRARSARLRIAIKN